MGREGSGVTESAGKVRLTFQFNSARCRETLDLKWSVSNRRAAENTLREIKEKIKQGEFDRSHAGQNGWLGSGLTFP